MGIPELRDQARKLHVSWQWGDTHEGFPDGVLSLLVNSPVARDGGKEGAFSAQHCP